jgi:hypothetical protein
MANPLPPFPRSRQAVPKSTGRHYFTRKSLSRASSTTWSGRHDCADKIRLRLGVNFIQVTLRLGQMHKLLDALVKSAFTDHIGARAEWDTHALLVE